MKRGLVLTSWGMAVLALAGYGAIPASAAGIYMWVATGGAVTLYNSTTTASNAVAVSGATFAAPAGGNYFSVAAVGTALNSQNVYVGDPGNNTVTAFTWNGTTMSSTAKVTLSTGSSGASPQEIALDLGGDLWALGFDGNIIEYSSTLGAIINTIGSSRIPN